MRRLLIFPLVFFLFLVASPVQAAYHFAQFRGRPPLHFFGSVSRKPKGITPEQIKTIYHLPEDGGQGTIVIIGAYDNPAIELDLQSFTQQFSLPPCTSQNGCFEKHKMGRKIKQDSS